MQYYNDLFIDQPINMQVKCFQPTFSTLLYHLSFHFNPFKSPTIILKLWFKHFSTFLMILVDPFSTFICQKLMVQKSTSQRYKGCMLKSQVLLSTKLVWSHSLVNNQYILNSYPKFAILIIARLYTFESISHGFLF